MTEKLSKEEIVLRLIRGANECGASLKTVYLALKQYFDDPSSLDRQPLLGWFNLGGLDGEVQQNGQSYVCYKGYHNLCPIWKTCSCSCHKDDVEGLTPR